MKKMILSMFLAALVSVTICSCGTHVDTASSQDCSGDLPPTSSTNSPSMTPEEVMEDVADVDLFHVPDFTGLEITREEDEEDGTAKIYYKKDGNTVYVVYEGYAGDGYDHIVTSRSGKELRVHISNEGGEAFDDIYGPDYEVHYSSMNKDAKYKADEVHLSIENKDTFPVEYSTYSYIHDAWQLTHSGFSDEEGYKVYKYYEDEEDGKSYESTTLLYEYLKEKPDCNYEFLKDPLSSGELYFYEGYHNFKCYKGDSDQWYMEADYKIIPDDEASIHALSQKYGLKESLEDAYEEDAENQVLVVNTGTILLPIAKDCAGFESFMAIPEFDDPVDQKVVLNDQYEIISIEYGGRISPY